MSMSIMYTGKEVEKMSISSVSSVLFKRFQTTAIYVNELMTFNRVNARESILNFSEVGTTILKSKWQ